MAIFKTNGVKIYYEDIGNKESNHCIAFFNGVAANTSSWGLIYPLLEKLGWRVILHDFKGQLKSDKPKGDYTFKEHADEARALFEHLGISKIHIVGTSYGGEVAMKFAMTHPDAVSSITVINSVSELDFVLTAFVTDWKRLARIGDAETFLLGMIPSVYGAAYLANHYDALIKRAKSASNLLTTEFFEGQQRLYDTFLNDVNMTNELHKINCPTLIIGSEQDILKPVKFSKIIADNIPQSEYITIPDCGHAAFLERPEILKSMILGFVMKQNVE